MFFFVFLPLQRLRAIAQSLQRLYFYTKNQKAFLLPIQDSLKRDFYAEMCRIENWYVRTVRKKIDSMLFERTAISRKPELVVQAELDALRKEDCLTPIQVNSRKISVSTQHNFTSFSFSVI